MPSDRPLDVPIVSSRLIHKGMVWNLVSETFEFEGEELTREFIDHTGAVAVLAINDNDEIMMLRQYRHPVRKLLMEIPAGLRDIEGESPLETAKRELLEEASLEADSFEELVSFFTTPGGNSEDIQIFVATGLREVESGHVLTGEERTMEKIWVPVSQALAQVLDSKIMSPSAVVAIMAYCLKHSIHPER